MSSEDLGPKEWLRCNNCYILMRSSKVPFFLSYCSHIFCTKCVKIVKKKCPQCSAQNLRTMPLVEPLRPEVKHCFESIENLSGRLSQASAFQNQQFAINSKRTSAIEKKYNYAKSEYHRISSTVKMLEKRYKEKANDLKLLRNKIHDVKESQRKIENSLSILTPQSSMRNVKYSLSGSSIQSGSDNQPFAKKKSFNNSKSTPMSLDLEFRKPTMTNVPRSVSSYSKNSSISSMGTPFANLTLI